MLWVERAWYKLIPALSRMELAMLRLVGAMLARKLAYVRSIFGVTLPIPVKNSNVKPNCAPLAGSRKTEHFTPAWVIHR